MMIIPTFSKQGKPGKIFLALLPYWTPQIPPMGIASLKSFLVSHGFIVKAIDANTYDKFDRIHTNYFDCLELCIPRERRGNFRNIGSDVLRNHMMAHLNRTDDNSYIELVKTVIYKTFFTRLGDDQVMVLEDLVGNFYQVLEKFVLDLIQEEEPAVLGLSVFSGSLPASLFTFKLVKEKAPHILNVMGGGIFADQLKVGSPGWDFFLEKTPYIDKIIAGEGEILFLKLLQGQLPVEKRVYTLADLGNEVLDIAKVDIPDFSDFNLELYPALSFYTSRSCPFQCSFCSETVQWGKYRKKKAVQIADELIRLYEKHRSQLFFMVDSLLNPVIQELADELIGLASVFYWDGYLRVGDAVCQIEKTEHWRRAGFYRARLGVESGSPSVLERMGKQISPEQVKAAIRGLAFVGIKTTTYWVVGYPGETEDDFLKTLELVTELKDDIYEAECNPFNYFLSGQVNSGNWAKMESIPLYPDAQDMLIVQSWALDIEPSREEVYRRVQRFVTHCEKCGIPNPYSLYDIDQADKRWKQIHKNAVPPLIEFSNKDRYIDECRGIKKTNIAGKNIDKDLSFRF